MGVVDSMLYEALSKKTLDEIDAGLQASAARHSFGIITVHDLKQTMARKGVEFGGRVHVYEVCNPHQAKKVLEANGAVSTALPCRISVYETPEGFKLATILPRELMKMFNSPELETVADEVESVLKAMIDEAA